MLDNKLVTAINKLDDTFIKQKSIASKLVDQHKQLQEALADTRLEFLFFAFNYKSAYFFF